MYWRIHDLWGPRNLVALCVTEMEAILPPHGCLEGIVHGPPTDAYQGITWKTYTRVRWAQIVSLIAL
jgi:hypothetical protein